MEASESAWEAAQRAAAAAEVSLVPLTDMDEALQVADVITQVWGEAELRPSLVRAFEHAGCGLYGAMHDARVLVGFVLGFLGWERGLHLHSHMLAVLPPWRSRGIGFALKLAQRAAVLDAGVTEARWTYDPLVARNGGFNLVKLGTVATAFLPGFYGEMSDRINRGDRSDRFEVRWQLGSGRVARAVGGRPTAAEAGPCLLDWVGDGDAPRPKETGARPEPGAMVRVPPDHASMRLSDPGLGWEWREASGRVFQACFDAGLAASWIDPRGRYVFRPIAEMIE